MDADIQLISDGQGLAVIGDPADVERFVVTEGLASQPLDLRRLRPVLSAGSAAATAGSELAANSGRWVKLTKQSSQAVQRYGLRQSSTSGLSTGVLRGSKGQIKGFVEFAKGPGAMLTNPAVLAGAAGIMAQVAMQQTMDEITDYLATIDAKVDDVLRAQTDAVLARMIGVGFVIEEAMTIRASRGRVDEVTWSKVQAAPATIAETQAYALRQLDALAEKVERATNISDLARATEQAQSTGQEWLAVLARCFQLQDGLAVLELDRVLDASPQELDGHRLGLATARQDRLELIARTTEQLIDRMTTAAGTANLKVLMHPAKAPAIVHSSNLVAGAVFDFHERLGIEHAQRSQPTRRWADAATDVKDRALETGADGVTAAKRLSADALEWTRATTGSLSSRIAERAKLRRTTEEDRFARTYEWHCDAPGCTKTIRSGDRVDFRVRVMSHRKAHIITELDPPFESVWDDDLWGEGPDRSSE